MPSMEYCMTDTEHLKVTVTGDNNVRFKLPQNSELDMMDLIDMNDKILENSTITNFEYTLRGKMDDRGKVCLYHQIGSKRNRKRKFIESVVIIKEGNTNGNSINV